MSFDFPFVRLFGSSVILLLPLFVINRNIWCLWRRYTYTQGLQNKFCKAEQDFVNDGLPGYNVNDGLPGYNVNDGLPGYNVNDGLFCYNVNDGLPGYNVNDGLPGYNVNDGFLVTM